MAQYYYDENGKEHKLLTEKEKKDEEASKAVAFFITIALFILVLIAPGIAVTSLFAGSIESTLWVWIWSLVFSGIIFGLLYWLYSKTSHQIRFTVATYLVLSGLSIWFLFSSAPDSNIVKTGKLLLPFAFDEIIATNANENNTKQTYQNNSYQSSNNYSSEQPVKVVEDKMDLSQEPLGDAEYEENPDIPVAAETVVEVAEDINYKATINDPDGYTNIREGKGTNYPIVDKLYKDEEFTVEKSDENWWYVVKNNGKKGYVHKSRIVIK
jgi:hypothetical protein